MGAILLRIYFYFLHSHSSKTIHHCSILLWMFCNAWPFNARERRRIHEMEAEAYADEAIKHIKDVGFAVFTWTLAGVALTLTPLFH
ncbi:hypothetical protein RSAG8_07983, partial [Rhizoctonia solani AG-8 WAC10335]